MAKRANPVTDAPQNAAPSAEVEAVAASWPDKARRRLFELRTLIYLMAASTPGVGRVTETLKWGEPAWLAKSGTTIRLAWSARRPAAFGLFVSCQTSLVETWRELYGDTLDCVGTREIRFSLDAPLPPRDALAHCIAMALTYKLR